MPNPTGVPAFGGYVAVPARRVVVRDPKRPFDIDHPYVDPCPTTGCWLWTGNVTKYGYPTLGDRTRAHRAFYEARYGGLRDDLVIDHTCRTRSCVNPDHLRQVTRAINAIENSLSPTALNKKKVACPRCGGPLSPVPHKRSVRRCAPCIKKSDAAWREKHKVRLAAYLKEWKRRNKIKQGGSGE